MSDQDPSAATTPQVLSGRYEIHRRLARGGMAEVFLARDSALDRPVAVKMLFPEFAADPSFVERFRREAQASANLAHPNIVGVYDWGSEAGTYFIIMEYVDGQSLAEVLRSAGPLHSRRAAEITFEIADALGFAHTRGVIHRDVKPGNVLISSTGVAKMTDFGIARALSSPSEDLTQAGSVMGTATYFSPEQAQGFAVDARSDLYSLGVVLYEMVCGRPPFTGESPVAIAYKHVQEPPPPPSRFVSGIPAGVEAIILKLLSKNPDNRYLSADDLRADLRRFLDGKVTMAEQAVAHATGAVAAAGAVVGAAAAAAALDPNATRIQRSVAAPSPEGVEAPPPGTVVPPSDAFGDEYEEPKSRTGLFVTLFAILLVALGGLVFWLITSLNSSSTDTTTIEVPNVVGRTELDAKAEIEKAGFTANPQPGPDPVAIVGTVASQTPAAKAQAPRGSTVTLIISTGPAPAANGKVPRVIGLTETGATAALKAAKFGVKVEQVDGTDQDKGNVLTQSPDPDTDLAEGSAVTIRVSQGSGNVAIPGDLAGKTTDQARKALTDAGFKVAPNTVEQPSADVAKGKVVGTDPEGSAKKDATITIIISAGPAKISVPALKGKTEAEATAILDGTTGGPKIEYERNTKILSSGDPNIGRVTDVDPVAGTKIDPGAIVTITVGVAGPPTTSPTGTSTTTSTSP